MLIVLSPAKRLNFAPAPPELPATRPQLHEDTAELARAARKLSRADLRRLMSISANLADLNFERFKAFDPTSDDGAVQAALAFAGDVYQGLRARELDGDSLAWAQDRIRILSGLYGVLRPLDRIQPYRLEMGTRLRTKRGANLYDFWGSRIAEQLNADARDHLDPTLVNLASHEYFGAVDARALQIPTVTIHFREETDGELKMVSFYAKKARGLMARYLIDRRLERSQDLKDFDRDGYRFDAALSTDQDWTFVRPHPPLKGA